MNITLINQRDQKWSSVKLGLSKVTVGSDGCLISDCCMAASYWGVHLTPDLVAQHTESFDKNGEYLWNYPNFPFVLEKEITGRNDTEIMKSLKDPNRAVVLQCDFGEHFVLGMSKNLFGSYKVADPWFGDTCDVVSRWKNITGSRHLILK